VMAGYFTAADAPAPADLTQQRLVDATDGYIYSVAVHGFGQYMPPFGNLIPGDDIWALVQYIRTLQQ
jgi:mono/diheme cytochrome c family protein